MLFIIVTEKHFHFIITQKAFHINNPQTDYSTMDDSRLFSFSFPTDFSSPLPLIFLDLQHVFSPPNQSVILVD